MLTTKHTETVSDDELERRVGEQLKEQFENSLSKFKIRETDFERMGNDSFEKFMEDQYVQVTKKTTVTTTYPPKEDGSQTVRVEEYVEHPKPKVTYSGFGSAGDKGESHGF